MADFDRRRFVRLLVEQWPRAVLRDQGSPDHVVDYTVAGTSFMPGEPRLWSDTHLFYTGTSNLDLVPDGKHFIVLALPEAASGEKGSVRVTMLLNFFDELKRKIP